MLACNLRVHMLCLCTEMQHVDTRRGGSVDGGGAVQPIAEARNRVVGQY